MNTLQRIPMASLAIIVSSIAAIGWVALDGTVPLVMSMVAGSIIALRSTLGDGPAPTEAR